MGYLERRSRMLREERRERRERRLKAVANVLLSPVMVPALVIYALWTVGMKDGRSWIGMFKEVGK